MLKKIRYMFCFSCTVWQIRCTRYARANGQFINTHHQQWPWFGLLWFKMRNKHYCLSIINRNTGALSWAWYIFTRSKCTATSRCIQIYWCSTALKVFREQSELFVMTVGALWHALAHWLGGTYRQMISNQLETLNASVFDSLISLRFLWVPKSMDARRYASHYNTCILNLWSFLQGLVLQQIWNPSFRPLQEPRESWKFVSDNPSQAPWMMGPSTKTFVCMSDSFTGTI